MLQNAYLDAKIGVDPAENEPSKVSAPNLSVLRQYTESLQEPADLRRERRGLDHAPREPEHDLADRRRRGHLRQVPPWIM